jgi:hypothetical protein
MGREMPFIEKRIIELNDRISDFGWEIGSVEYEIDMIPNEEECLLLKQHDLEVSRAYEEKGWKND